MYAGSISSKVVDKKLNMLGWVLGPPSLPLATLLPFKTTFFPIPPMERLSPYWMDFQVTCNQPGKGDVEGFQDWGGLEGRLIYLSPWPWEGTPVRINIFQDRSVITYISKKVLRTSFLTYLYRGAEPREVQSKSDIHTLLGR